MLSPHQVLCGRFQVEALLGEGGMGQVWEALDLELREHIAIKAIRSDIAGAPGVLSRFKREVYAARKITHPNVCRTFDLECHTPTNDGASPEPAESTTFLTMELLRGETLARRLRRAGPLGLDQVYMLALQVANALQAAHDVGIIHCDLKPANIFMTGTETRLRAVVTDFGIAKVIQAQDETSSPILAEAPTLPGAIAGTPMYMAPEQFQGRHCTAGTDIYCYGLVLYEALTGERASPYSRSQTDRKKEIKGGAAATAEAVTVPAIEPHWNALLDNCLKIDPEERFSDVQQVLDMLHAMPSPYSPGIATDGSGRALPRSPTSRLVPPTPAKKSPLDTFRRHRKLWLAALALILVFAGVFAGVLSRYGRTIFTSQSAADIPSVAVLPPVAAGNDPALTALSEGVADALTNNLAQVSGLRVPSQTAVRSLGKTLDVRSASHQLDVAHIVAGSITKDADTLHLQIELVDAKTEQQLWGQIYTTKPDDLAALEGDIAQEVAFRLQMEANRTSAGKTGHEHETVPASEEAYQKGRAAMAGRTPEGFDQAVAYFQQAIDADPQNASAVAELAQCFTLMAYNYNRPEPPLALLNHAEDTARRALRMDSASAEAYTTLAEAELLRDYNWDSAERDYKRAVELDPGYLNGHVQYALHVLTAQGRFAEARAQYAYADRVTQKSISTQVSEALTAYYEGRFQDSATRAEEIRKQAPGIWFVAELLAGNYIAIGQPEKAVALLTSATVGSGDASSVRDAMLGIAYARLGKKDEAIKQLQRIERPGASGLNYTLATLSAAVGLNDKAMDHLDKAYTNKESDILFIKVDPLLDPLRQDARFQKLLSKMNLH